MTLYALFSARSSGLERDKGDNVLDLEAIDLGDLVQALEDHSDEQLVVRPAIGRGRALE